jgi:hypothetical protein
MPALCKARGHHPLLSITGAPWEWPRDRLYDSCTLRMPTLGGSQLPPINSSFGQLSWAFACVQLVQPACCTAAQVGTENPHDPLMIVPC